MDTFLDVIEDLGKGRVVVTVLGDGSKHHEWHEPLIAQLRSAVAANLTGGNGVSASAHRMPLNADALELYQAIDRDISEAFFEENLGVPGLLPEENLLALYTQRWQDDDSAETTVRGWRSQINNLFDPAKKVPLSDPCPVCKATHFTNEAGDLCANPVVVTYRVGNPFATVKASCRGGCGTEWVGAEAVEELIGELTDMLTEGDADGE